MMNLGVSKLQTLVKKHGGVSEDALALTFAEFQGDRWRYCGEDKTWLQWIGTHWVRGQNLQLLDSLRAFLSVYSRALCAVKLITPAASDRYRSQRVISAVEKLCRGLPSFLAPASIFDANEFLLGTLGGTVDLNSGEMSPARREDYITVLTKVTPAPVGTPLGPRFAKFLDDITGGDRDFVRTLQQWFGISASGSSRDQKILFLYGPGGNGKGVLLRTIAGLLGNHAVSAPRDLLMLHKHSHHNTHLIDVLNARMALATEIDDNEIWDVALIKNMTGGDEMPVNRMRCDPFRVNAKCSITISGNRKPALQEVDEAVRRRFIVATFPIVVRDVVPDLEKQFIKDEGPSILRWVIDGHVAREAEGKLFVAPALVEDTEDYLAEEDALGDFIETYLVEAPGQKIKTAEVYHAWRAYCTRFKRDSGARNSFTTAMRAAGIEYSRTMDGRYFLNVIIKEGVE